MLITFRATAVVLLSVALTTVSLSTLSGCGEAPAPPAGAPTEQPSGVTIDQGQEGAPPETAPADGAAAPQTKTAALADGEWGTLTGRIVFDGKAPAPKPIDTSKDPTCKEKLTTENLIVSPDGGLVNAVVMLRTKGVKIHPDYDKTATAELTLDNKNCRFEPHVQVVRLKQPLLLKNSDPTGHNTNIAPLLGKPINPILAANSEPIPYNFTAEEAVPVKVSCNIHPWMGAWIVARTDPYAAVTDKDGRFTIKDLPVGKELEFRLWQESAGYLKNATFKGGKADARGTFKLKLKPGENDLGDIKVSSSIFKK
jgi:hypothetical protein